MGHDTKQLSLLREEKENKPVTCLGRTFANENERRTYFTEQLRQKLPELKQQAGFPLGEDEDILALSDPPYYTACPNPWMNDIIAEWESEKEASQDNADGDDQRKPFTADVREGKNDPIYNAHSYHTKVPHKAIMRYILHYTDPGDIVFDGFAGTGMTGVAAQMCGDRKAVESLGYQVLQDGTILDEEGRAFSRLGARKAILNDLSPAASFIAYNYNTPVDAEAFAAEANRILAEVEEECGWMYETQHVIDGEVQTDHKGNPVIGRLNYTVWSDVFVCPNCTSEIVFWEVAVDQEAGKVRDTFTCPSCGAEHTKRSVERAWVTTYDTAIQETVRQAKQVPVLINYSVGKKRFEKRPDDEDLALLKRIEEMDMPYWFPKERIPEGDKTGEPLRIGITHVYHFYTERNLGVLSLLMDLIERKESQFIRLVFQSVVSTLTSKLVRYNLGNRGNGPLSGTLYISSLVAESNVLKVFRGKVRDFIKIISTKRRNIVSTQSLSRFWIGENKVDYIFTDPPFGANIMYSELNFLWESWLKVRSNNESEAIVNKTQGKQLPEYQRLMEACFRVYYRVLKPDRWMTVEFSNSQARVWNAIQEAIQRAGFVIANVSALDKKQGSFNAVTSTTAVKQDLIISAYKPSERMECDMERLQNTEESAWVFVEEHLKKVSDFLGEKGQAEVIVERIPRILFDRMVAYHVQHGLPVPLSSAEFQAEVARRFPLRDGMVFLESQVAEYDKKRILVKEFAQLSLFVSDENSAIEWIRQRLMKKPQTRQDLQPAFLKEIQHIAKHEVLPELDELLAENFLKYEADGPVPDQIASYLRKNYKDLRGLDNTDPKLIEKAAERWYVPDPSKQADLEKLRERALLREFAAYTKEIEQSKKRLRLFRTEAVRAGFEKAWSEKDYEKIAAVGDRLPEKVLQEDDKLLRYYDNALVRLGR